MKNWIEGTGTSRADLINKANIIQSKIHQFLKATLPGYIGTARYAQWGSSMRLHKIQLKFIILAPEGLRWDKIKSRTAQIPGWIIPKQIANNDINYFNTEL